MRHEIEKDLLDKEYSRGDFALAVIKNNEVKKICRLDAYTEHADNQDILNASIKYKAKIYKVQFLSSNAISSSFPMDLQNFYVKHNIN